MPMPTGDDYKLVNKNQDDAIAELVDAVLREHPEGRPTRYSDPVYKAAWKVAEACKALEAGNPRSGDAAQELIPASDGDDSGRSACIAAPGVA
jgi:hypothetical protein